MKLSFQKKTHSRKMRLEVWTVNSRNVDLKTMSQVIKDKLDILAQKSTTLPEAQQ